MCQFSGFLSWSSFRTGSGSGSGSGFEVGVKFRDDDRGRGWVSERGWDQSYVSWTGLGRVSGQKLDHDLCPKTQPRPRSPTMLLGLETRPRPQPRNSMPTRKPNPVPCLETRTPTINQTLPSILQNDPDPCPEVNPDPHPNIRRDLKIRSRPPF